MTNFNSGNDGLLSIVPTAPREMRGGWIYILMTRSDGNRVKIGKTKNNPIERLAKLRCGDPYLAMIGSFFVPESMGEIKHIEQWVHDWFEGSRIRFAEHIRPYGNMPAHWLDDGDLIAYSEWFKMDVLDASGYLQQALEKCLEVDRIYLANWYSAGSYPTGLAFYTQEMLTEMFGRPVNVDDDYELGDQPDGRIPW
ncbi:GIY-YIG nuclease family protein [Variovorax sp. RA8]|uniref:GIY-YIG nuclease family protein n=1 Tax=Variovorax sp. (strain JCM 16519 / RA8) TaxID=662548 RepID=UPI000A73F313|nr:GIY-YIG nuclease family protein [Variovorax sp. RA8]VTU44177.1 T5orf172 domain protein [Variovorax sp. RA8]